MSSLSIFNNLEILRHHAYIQRENFQTVLQRIYEVNLQRVQRIQRIFCTTAFLVQIILFSSVTSIFFIYSFSFIFLISILIIIVLVSIAVYLRYQVLNPQKVQPVWFSRLAGYRENVRPVQTSDQYKCQTSTNVRPVQMSDQYKRQTSANIGPV